MKKILLIDGSSYLYRAYHALPDLRNQNNEPSEVIYGVLNMLKKTMAEYTSDFVVCVFDAKGKTFRNDIYSDYKANRPHMPEDLAIQIEPLKKAIHALGVSMLSIEGVEADDVIGTLAEDAVKQDMKVIISTGDKDLAQRLRYFNIYRFLSKVTVRTNNTTCCFTWVFIPVLSIYWVSIC